MLVLLVGAAMESREPSPRLVYFASKRFPGVYAVTDGYRVQVVTPDTVVESDDYDASEQENVRFGREVCKHPLGWCPAAWRRIRNKDPEWLLVAVLFAPLAASFVGRRSVH